MGKVVAKALAKHFRTLDALQKASLEELLEVDGVGKIIAESVIRYFRDDRNRMLIGKLEMAGVVFEISEEDGPLSDVLSGKSVVISGVFKNHSREEYKDMIEKYGGKNVSSISSKTSFVLAGDNMGPAKLQKAQSLGVSIISEEEFLEMIKE